MTDLIKATELLLTGEYTCVLCKGDDSQVSDLRGVKPLVNWYDQNADFSGYSAADKVVGKATAFLYLLIGVKAVYANIISRSALRLLEQNGVYVEHGSVVNNIINRSGDGICPFEAAVLDTNDKAVAYKIIRDKMSEMNIN